MLPGALTEQIDVAQVVTWLFFILFTLLIIYLRREDRREGYPLRDPSARGRPVRSAPGEKHFWLMDGGETATPHDFPEPALRATAPLHAAGNRLSPTGDPLLSGIGPAAYAMRGEQPFRNGEGVLEIQPLRHAGGWTVAPGDADPRGMPVQDAKGVAVGTVVDLWVDREVRILRYLEVALTAPPRRVLVPIYAISVRARGVRVRGLRAAQFAGVPVLADPDQISAREEDRVNAYYAGGEFFNRGTR